MMAWRRRHTLIAGLVLILLANAIALLGVAYNRSGQPESQLVFTQRELESPNWWRYGKEDSSLSLRLRWRVMQPAWDGQQQMWPSYYSGFPEWLDGKKLLELGFGLPTAINESGSRRREMQKEVLLVLELNGPVYQQALYRAREHLVKEQAVFNAMPGSKEFERRLKSAQEGLAREENENSRLFAVDAGLDAAVLRAEYPARDRYLIVSGRICPVYRRSDRGQIDQWVGYIGGIDNDSISVPLEFLPVFGRARTVGAPGSIGGVPFEAVVAFGKRREPWLVSVKRP